jgi:hypothetical protein
VRLRPGSLAIFFALVLASEGARALDKQGSGAHGGSVEGDDSGFHLSGAASMGVSLDNPSYAARPDNSGLTLMRYALHVDADVIGRRLSIPFDLNAFSDRQRKGVLKLSPTELDVITGVTSTWGVGPGALEIGSRFEQDSPVDRGSFNQRYVDVRARYLYSLAHLSPRLAKALVDGDVSGWLTLGWFAVNPTYAARPDNSGIALFRYAFRTEISLVHDIISFGLDATIFTDRQASDVFRPSELDWTEEIIGRRAPWEVHLAYEQDHPLDRGGLVQSFVYVLAAYEFDLVHAVPHPLEDRGMIPSP